MRQTALLLVAFLPTLSIGMDGRSDWWVEHRYPDVAHVFRSFLRKLFESSCPLDFNAFNL